MDLMICFHAVIICPSDCWLDAVTICIEFVTDIFNCKPSGLEIL